MNDQQLEAVLRSSLARHAATIDAGPAWPPQDLRFAPAPRRNVPWWPIAATVAAVLAVIGIVVAVRHSVADHRQPVTPVVVTRTACTIDLSPAWQRAIDAGTLRNPDLGQVVLGGAPDGTILVSRASPTTIQTVLVSPDGATRIVQQRPTRSRYGVTRNAMIDNRWIVLPIADRLAPVNRLLEFDVFDRATLQLTERVSIAEGSGIGAWALFDGHLYWTQPHSGSTGSLLEHDLAARTTRTLAPDGVRNLLSSPAGVAWTDAQNRTHLVAGAPPDQIPGQPGTHPGLVTDGRSYAWHGTSGIAWYSTATKETVVVQGFPGPGLEVTVLAVAGPYVLLDAGNHGPSGWLIDTRTGAAASFQAPGSVASGGGILAYTAESAVVLHVDQLPQLTC